MLTWVAGLLIVLAGFVRARGAGLACPDWPLCYGHAVPAFNAAILAQWAHRVGSFLLFFALLTRAVRRPKQVWLNSVALVASAVYLALGALAVLKTMEPWVIAAQPLCGLVMVGVLAAAKSPFQQRRPVGSETRWGRSTKLFTAGAGLVVAVIALGSVISAEQAGLACPTLLSCHGLLLPRGDMIVGLHLAHRALSFALLAGSASLPILLAKESLTDFLRFVVRVMPLFVLAEMALGFGGLLFRLPWALSVVHLALSVGLFALLVQAALESRIVPLRRRGKNDGFVRGETLDPSMTTKAVTL